MQFVLLDHICVHQTRANDGRDETKSGAGEGEVSDGSEEADGVGEAAGCG